MSRVYFHSPSGEAELFGAERAWCGALIRDISLGFATVHNWERWDSLLTPGHTLAAESRKPGEKITFMDRLRLYLSVSYHDDEPLAWKGHPIEAFALLLNTALLTGNNEVRLAARIHGQCEIHGYMEGEDRASIAVTILTGLKTGLYREGGWQRKTVFTNGRPTLGDSAGISPGDPGTWEHVAAFLLHRNDEPVVMSYSVCDPFPNPGPDGEENSTWHDLPGTQKWEQGMAWLRTLSDGRRLQPEGWEDFRFEHGLTIPGLLAHDHTARLDAAFGTE